MKAARFLWPGFAATRNLTDILSKKREGRIGVLQVEMWPLLLLMALLAIQVLFFTWRVMNPHLAMLLILTYALVGLGISNTVVLNTGAYATGA